MAINNGIGRVWAANAGDEGRPAGVGPVWIENIDAITPSGTGGHTYTGGHGIDVDNENDTISLDTEAQAAIESYVTNSASFLTNEDLNGYATETFVTNEIESATSAFVTSADLPDLDGYATETWVSGQGYMKNLFEAEYGVTSYADIESAYNQKKIVYCRITSGSSGDRMAPLSYHYISSEGSQYNYFMFQYYRSTDGNSNDEVVIYKVLPDNSWTTEQRIAGNRADWTATSGKSRIRNKPDLSVYATTSGMEEYVTEQTSAFVTSADIPEVPGVKDLIAGNGINISATSADVTISVDNAIFNGYATETWVQSQDYVDDTEMSEYVTSATSAFVTSGDIPEVPGVKDLIAGNGINISATSADVTIAADTSVLATQADLGPYATQTWTAQNYFPIDGLQIVSSSAEASGANIIYIVSGSNE